MYGNRMNKFISIAIMAFVFTSITSASTGFRNGAVVSLNYSAPNGCSSSLSTIFNNYPEAVNASAVTNCESGTPVPTPANSFATYVLVPSFAGLSIYGQTGWNATAQGYPTFWGNTIVTQCGAAGTPAGCATSANSVINYYSLGVSNWEKTLGITNGKFGLPEGVMPNAARDRLIPNVTSGYTYLVRVGVNDPNIFPNATTGKCTQVVASNQTKPTANCLNSTAALARALVTSDSAVVTANKNNPLYNAKGPHTTQASISINNVSASTSTGVLAYTVNLNSTTNMNISNFNVARYLVAVSPLTPAKTTAATTAATTVAATTAPTTISSQTTSQQQTSSGSSTLWIIGVIVVVIIIVAAYFMMAKKK